MCCTRASLDLDVYAYATLTGLDTRACVCNTLPTNSYKLFTITYEVKLGCFIYIIYQEMQGRFLVLAF